MIVISPAYSFNSIPIAGKHENVIFFDSSDSRRKLFSETTMQLETSPEASIFVMIGSLKSFVIVISLEALAPGAIFPKFRFPGPRSKPEFSPAMNLVEIVCL